MNKATIKAVTAVCERTDCRLSSWGFSGSLHNIADEYDREGKLLDRPKNVVTEHVSCTTCKSAWTVTHEQDSDPRAERRAA